jgi:hypothetical protein
MLFTKVLLIRGTKIKLDHTTQIELINKFGNTMYSHTQVYEQFLKLLLGLYSLRSLSSEEIPLLTLLV